MSTKISCKTMFQGYFRKNYSFEYRSIMFLVLLLSVVCSAIADPKNTEAPTITTAEPVQENVAALPSVLVPQVKDVENDPVQEIIPSAFEGKITYAFSAKGSKEFFPSYLVWRYIGKKDNDTKSPQSSRTYKLVGRTTHSVVFNPQFSPDGRYILFKIGNPYNTTGSYYLYVLDTQTNQLKQASGRELSYQTVLWSPDGDYLAYVAGGDYEGNVGHLFGDPLRLFICNWRDGKETLIVKNDSVRGSFTWANSSTLLYGILPSADQSNLPKSRETAEQKGNNKKVASALRPNIYEYSIVEDKSRLLIEDGYRPDVSPDGKWIAFFGSENPDKPLPLGRNWMIDPNYSSLTIASYSKTKRISLTREKGRYPAITWRIDANDEQHVITLNQTQPSPNAKAEIRDWDIKTKKFRRVAELTVTDSIAFHRSAIRPQFEIQGMPDEKHTFASVSEIGDFDKNTGGYATYTTLLSINLLDGNVDRILKSRPVVDWHFISVQVPNN